MRGLFALLVSFVLASPALAQTRQPAQITSIPSTTPQRFDILDKTGTWVPLGTAANGVLNEVWSDSYRASSGSDCGSLQAAYAALRTTGGTIRLPARTLSTGTNCQVLIDGAAVEWVGQGWAEGAGRGMTPPLARPPYGTWIEIADATKPLFYVSGTSAAGTRFHDLALSQATVMPLPSATDGVAWAPTVMPPAIHAQDTGGYLGIENVYCYATYECVKAYNMGRLSIRGLFGQSFKSMIDLDVVQDVPWIDEVHGWGFWSYNSNVVRWQNQNSDVFRFARVDGPMVGRVFGINMRSIFHFVQGAGGGTVQRFFVNQIYADGTRWPLFIDNLNLGVTGHIGMLDAQHVDNSIASPVTSMTNASLIRMDGTNANPIIQIDQVRDDFSWASVIDFTNTDGMTLHIDKLWADRWGYGAGQSAAPLVGTKNQVGSESVIQINDFVTINPGAAAKSNATSDFVTIGYQATQATGAALNMQTMETFAHGIRQYAHGSISRQADGVIVDTAVGNIALQAGAASHVVLGTQGNCGFWVDPIGLIPGLSDGTTAGCNISLGTGAFPFFDAWLTSLHVLGNATVTGSVAAASYKIGSTAGFTGTKTAGTCVMTINGGIITNVTGC